MINNYLKLILQFILLVLAQILIFNQISILSYAVPLLYIYFILKLPVNFNQNLVLLLAFVLGFCVDSFSTTYGVNTSATVLAAFLRPYIQKIFFSVEDMETIVPSVSKLGVGIFYKYATCIVLVHHSAVFLIEYMSSMNLNALLHIASSSLLTMVLIVILESFSFGQTIKNERR